MFLNKLKFGWGGVFWLVVFVLTILLGVCSWFYYYRGIIPGTNIRRITQNSIGVDLGSPLSVDSESGYFYGRGVVVENNNGTVFVEFVGGERREIVYYGGDNTILYDNGKEYYGADKIERWQMIKADDSVVIVFSPEMIATYVKVN